MIINARLSPQADSANPVLSANLRAEQVAQLRAGATNPTDVMGVASGDLIAAAVVEAGGAVSGVGSVTWLVSALASTGDETFSGSASETFSVSALASTAAETFTGTGSQAFAASALSATAAETFTGAAMETVSVFSIDGAGAQAFAGSGAVTVGVSSLSGSGVEAFTGSAETTFGVSALDAVGATSSAAVTGTGDMTIAVSSLAGSGAVPVAVTSAGGVSWRPEIFRRPLRVTPSAVTGRGSIRIVPPSVHALGVVSDDALALQILDDECWLMEVAA